MNGPVVAAALAVVFLLLWAIVSVLRRGQHSHNAAINDQARDGLRQFADQSLSLESVLQILTFSREVVQVIFGSERVVVFETGAERGQWDASIPGDQALGEVPTALRGLFGWFKHNTAIAARDDLGAARFGAMRNPLRQVMDRYDVDVVLPLVSESQVIAVLAIKLGRTPSAADRELMRLFRLQATAACANVRLHVEAAHMVSLAKEVDLASAVKLALVPDEMDGRHSRLSWAGYYQAVGDAGSDFWGIYPVDDQRIMVVIGDATGAGLAGSLVSAVVKSCADAIFAASPASITPSALLGAMNRALYRSSHPVHTSCVALLFDLEKNVVSFSNAGHPFPYRLEAGGGLGILPGAGPLLGDEAKADYKMGEVQLSAGGLVVVFTDGLVQARDAKGDAYGERKLQKLLKLGRGEANLLRDEIVRSIADYRGSRGSSAPGGGGDLSPAAPTDDAALLVLRLD